MKYILYTIMLSCFISGCDINKNRKSFEERAVDEDKLFITQKLKYYKDPNTNLCFAGYILGWNASVFTNVPCTKEVEAAIR